MCGESRTGKHLNDSPFTAEGPFLNERRSVPSVSSNRFFRTNPAARLAISRYSPGSHPSTGKQEELGGDSAVRTLEARARAEIAIPFQAVTTFIGLGGMDYLVSRDIL